jgi:hypothetical protein
MDGTYPLVPQAETRMLGRPGLDMNLKTAARQGGAVCHLRITSKFWIQRSARHASLDAGCAHQLATAISIGYKLR